MPNGATSNAQPSSSPCPGCSCTRPSRPRSDLLDDLLGGTVDDVARVRERARRQDGALDRDMVVLAVGVEPPERRRAAIELARTGSHGRRGGTRWSMTGCSRIRRVRVEARCSQRRSTCGRRDLMREWTYSYSVQHHRRSKEDRSPWTEI